MESVRVILEALQTGHAQLAISTVNRELRENPQSDVYLSLKVHVAHTLLDKTSCLKASEEAVKVCSKKTLTMFLVPAFIDYHMSDLALSAFQRVDRLSPQDNELRELWLQTALALGDLSSAQKALMAIQRNAKNPRSAAFACCIVMAEVKPTNRQLFPILAQRLLANFLPVKSPQECFVVAKVHQMESEEKMVDYLQDESLKPFLAGSLDLQLLLLNGLRNLERWIELKEYAISQLEKIDSYNYWEALNTASVNLKTTDEAIELRKKFKGINAKLAAVDLAYKTGDDLEGNLISYWGEFGANPSSFKFLKPFISAELVEKLGAHQESLGQKINVLKLQNAVASANNGKNKTDVHHLIELYSSHESEAPDEKKEYFIGTDALLLAAVTLIEENDNREGAITLLEYALKLDPHHFYVRIMLVELYNSLGTTQLARIHFNALSIKNIQYETLGFLLATRIGTLSPADGKSVLEKLSKVRSRTPNFGEYGSASLCLASAYTQFIGVFELGKKLNRSLGHALEEIEALRAARINGESLDLTGLVQLIDPESELIDNRDFTTRFGDHTLPQLLVGPQQLHEYVAIFRAKELALLEKLRDKTLSETTKSALRQLPKRAHASQELTPEEVFNIESICSELLESKVKHPIPEFDTSLPLDWRFFHWAYTLLETTKTLKELSSLDIKPIILRGVKHYLNQLSQAEQGFVSKVRAYGIPGDASQYARKIKNEHSRKLEALQHFLK